jgi:AraC-like DNA-binding protein
MKNSGHDTAGLRPPFRPTNLPGTPAVHTWSTDQVEPRDRFDYWREVRARGLFGVTAELAPEARPAFVGEFSLRKFGTASLVELRASPYAVERSARDIANAPGDSLCIYQQLGSGSRFTNPEFAIHGGMFATSYSDLAYSTSPLGADGFHLRILKVPAAGLCPSKARLVNAGLGDLAAKPFTDHRALSPLVASCFHELLDTDDTGDLATPMPLVQTLVQLALIERGLIRSTSRGALEALRNARLSLARRLIAQHLSDPRMSPAFVAGLLGISIRHLHILFEGENGSFSETVTEQRIGHSRRLLCETPKRPVADIARACGFESLATFYRVFQTANGMTPGDFRSQAAADDRQMTVWPLFVRKH